MALRKSAMLCVHLVNAFDQETILFTVPIPLLLHTELETFKIAIHRLVARKLQLPCRFVRLIWSVSMQQFVETSTGECGCFTLSWVLSIPDTDLPEECVSSCFCDCCGDPCEDADDVPEDAIGGRIWKCPRCRPCFLCRDCRVELLNGEGFVISCMFCLEDAEVWYLEEPHARRWKVLTCWCEAMDARHQRGIWKSHTLDDGKL